MDNIKNSNSSRKCTKSDNSSNSKNDRIIYNRTILSQENSFGNTSSNNSNNSSNNSSSSNNISNKRKKRGRNYVGINTSNGTTNNNVRISSSITKTKIMCEISITESII